MRSDRNLAQRTVLSVGWNDRGMGAQNKIANICGKHSGTLSYQVLQSGPPSGGRLIISLAWAAEGQGPSGVEIEADGDTGAVWIPGSILDCHARIDAPHYTSGNAPAPTLANPTTCVLVSQWQRGGSRPPSASRVSYPVWLGGNAVTVPIPKMARSFRIVPTGYPFLLTANVNAFDNAGNLTAAYELEALSSPAAPAAGSMWLPPENMITPSARTLTVPAIAGAPRLVQIIFSLSL